MRGTGDILAAALPAIIGDHADRILGRNGHPRPTDREKALLLKAIPAVLKQRAKRQNMSVEDVLLQISMAREFRREQSKPVIDPFD